MNYLVMMSLVLLAVVGQGQAQRYDIPRHLTCRDWHCKNGHALLKQYGANCHGCKNDDHCKGQSYCTESGCFCYGATAAYEGSCTPGCISTDHCAAISYCEEDGCYCDGTECQRGCKSQSHCGHLAKCKEEDGNGCYCADK